MFTFKDYKDNCERRIKTGGEMKFSGRNIKTFLVLCTVFAGSIIYVSCTKTAGGSDSGKDNGVNVLLLMNNPYGANYFLNRDEFEQYGWNMTHASVTGSIKRCTGDPGGLLTIVPDLYVKDIKDITRYDAVAIMPSPGQYRPVPNSFGDLLASKEALSLVSSAVEKGLTVSTICTGLRVLAKADVLKSRRIVGAPRFKNEYEAAGANFLGKDFHPEIDKNIVTSARDQYYNNIVCEAVATSIENTKRRNAGKTPPKEKYIFQADAVFAKDKTIWAKTYGGEFADGGKALCETADGGFLITGYSFSQGSGDADLLVIKTDSGGNEIWSETYGGCGTEYGYGCLPVQGGYLITGYTTSFKALSKDVFLKKIDESGKEIWSKTYGGKSWDVGMDLAESKDGSFYICGYTHSSGAGEEDVFLIKTDGSGNEIWHKTYGGKRYEKGNSVICTDDGDCIIGAVTGTFGNGNCDFYLIKTDADGKEVWKHPYGKRGFDWCSSMAAAKDGGFILTGHTNSDDFLNACVIKTDADGNQEWLKSFGKTRFYDYGNSIDQLKDGSIVVAGTAKLLVRNNAADKHISDPANYVYNNEFYIVKLDQKGNIIRQETIGGPGSEWSNSVHSSKDGSIIVLGQTNSAGNGSFDVCLLKLKIQ